MKCLKCGTEVFNSNICPNCGTPLSPVSEAGQGMRTLKTSDVMNSTSNGQAAFNENQIYTGNNVYNENPTYNGNPAYNGNTINNGSIPYNGNPVYSGYAPGQASPSYTRVEKKKNSVLGIVSIILTCTIILSLFGFILGIIDLCIKDGKKKTLSVISVCIAGFFVLIGVASSIFSKNDKGGPESVEIVADKDTTVENDKDLAKTETPAKENDISGEAVYEISDTGFEYYKNSIGSTEYYGYVEITNTGNKNLYLDSCTFDLEDNDGHLLQSDSFISKCPDVIAPGEKGYFYNSIGENLIDDSVSTANGIKLVPQMKIENASGNPVDYEVSDTALKEDTYGGVKVTGRITNNTNEDDEYLYINIIFYDTNGKVIGITGTSVTDLDAGRTVSFDTTTIWGSDSITVNSVADYEVIARKDYFQF